MSNNTQRILLATFVLTSTAYGAQDNNVYSVLLNRQLGKQGNGIQQFLDEKRKPFIINSTPHECIPIGFVDYKRIAQFNIFGETIRKCKNPMETDMLIIRTSDTENPFNLLPINSLDGIQRLKICEITDHQKMTEGPAIKVESVFFANTNITISNDEAKKLKNMFPWLTTIILASRVKGRQNEMHVDFNSLGLNIGYYGWQIS